MKRIVVTVCLAVMFALTSGCAALNQPPEKKGTADSGLAAAPSSEFPEQSNVQGVQGLEDWQLQTLANLGYSQEDMLTLTDDQIAMIFAPGTPLDGSSFVPNEEQLNALAKVNIDMEMSVVLGNLGYTYEEMLVLSAEELDFIFPNTELVDNLVKKGFARENVVNLGAIEKKGYDDYQEVIKEALTK